MLVMAGMNSMLTLMCISVFRWVVLTQKVTRPEIKCWQHNCVNLNLNNHQQQSVVGVVCSLCTSGEQQEAGLGGGGDGGSHLDLEPPSLLPPAPGLGLLQTR